jgi:hypothetical protein
MVKLENINFGGSALGPFFFLKNQFHSLISYAKIELVEAIIY